MNLRKRQRASAEHDALDALRGRILGGLHSGRLRGGERLPSYRTVADELGLDVRAAGRIYSALAREGLVEIRGKSGVQVASHPAGISSSVAEPVEWTVDVLARAWERRVPLQDFPELLRRSICSLPLRCACVESTADQLFTLCQDLRRDFGLRTFPVRATDLTHATAFRSDATGQLADADLIVTTALHASAVRASTTAMDKPLVVVRLDPRLSEHVKGCLEREELTIICVDPTFPDRLRLVMTGGAGHVRSILAGDRISIRRLDPATPVLVTPAARAELGDVLLPPSILPQDGSTIAPDSALELIATMVRLNLDRMRRSEDPPLAVT